MISETTSVRSTAPKIDEMIAEKQRKDAEEERARQELKRKRQHRGPMTAEERAARLAAMESDASKAEENKSKRLKAWQEVESAEKAREKKDITGDASFLDDVQAKAFAQGGTLAENLGRRAHFRQGRADALA